MKIWLDDKHDDPKSPKRHAPEGFIAAKNLAEVMEIVLRRFPSEGIEIMSFDHDLADFDAQGKETTGYDVIKWLAAVVRYTASKSVWPKEIRVHSSNIRGAENIRSFALNFNAAVINRWEEWLIESGNC